MISQFSFLKRSRDTRYIISVDIPINAGVHLMSVVFKLPSLKFAEKEMLQVIISTIITAMMLYCGLFKTFFIAQI